MSSITRRSFIKIAAAAPVALTLPNVAYAARGQAKVVVIGGGFGGATAAKYIKIIDPGIEVTLIEPNKIYTSCPLSNKVITGFRDIKTIQIGYDGLKKRGVKVVHDWVTEVDRNKKVVITKGGNKFSYDSVVMSPGVEFHYDNIDGYSESLIKQIPHAWKAGEQTLLLNKQLMAIPDGGTFVIVVPKGPFRCPPGPYERASLAASYFMRNGKKKSKVIILDANERMSKKRLFNKAWGELYGWEKDGLGSPGMIEWVKASEGGAVNKLDAKTKTVSSDIVKVKADVLNIIPAHKAGKIAVDSGLALEDGWCKVVPMTMASAEDANIYTIGDSCVAGELPMYGSPDSRSRMPKSAHIAMTQAKVVAAAIVAKFNDLPVPNPYYINTCYSYVDVGYSFSVVQMFRVEDGTFKFIRAGSGLSKSKMADGSPVATIYRELEAEYGDGWIRNVLANAFI